MEAVAGVGALISSTEALYRDRRSEPHLTDWEVMRSRHPMLLVGRWAPFYGRIANDRAVTVAHVVRAACTIVLIAGAGPLGVRGACALVAAATITLAAIRSPYGLDGADQMMVLTLAAVGLARFGGGGVAYAAAIAFVAAQVSLSYLIAGLAKVISTDWRAGDALPGIFSTAIYGWAPGDRVLSRSPRVGRALSFGTMGWETLFPLALVVPPPACAALLCIGAGFHLSSALTMHLNTFLWAFVAAYPAVWWVNAQVHL
jgi:hypothetical protein